mgnify:CR=1 FL=1
MPNFITIHTAYGLEALAAAEASDQPINLVEVAVGDGNGNEVTPDEAQTSLVRERFRDTVNRVYQHPDDNTRYTVELVIPASEGGFTLREVGIYDDQGGLFVVGNLPATYKPADGDGAFADTVVRVEFSVGNAAVITLQVDPNVVVATRAWVLSNVGLDAVVPGGTTGQVLKKTSNADGDADWEDFDTINVTVDTIEEEQTLADLQTQVDLVTVTTRGLVVYVDKQRLFPGAGADQWQIADAPNDETRIILGQSYTAGTKIILAQNEPTGGAGAPLERDLNLSDLQSAATARNNLGVYSKAETDQKAPAGMVATFARSTAPTGWLKANGALVSRTAYANLFAAIGTTYGAGDGFNTFALPDARGEFIRGWDDGRGVDSGRSFGSSQAGMVGPHTHNAQHDNISNRTFVTSASTPNGAPLNVQTASGAYRSGGNTSPTTTNSGTETRPRSRNSRRKMAALEWQQLGYSKQAGHCQRAVCCGKITSLLGRKPRRSRINILVRQTSSHP